jgi:transcriptional regulator with GAF, ATPase, and Fis domain
MRRNLKRRPESQQEVIRTMASISTEKLAEVFVEISDTLVDEFDLIEFLQTVTARTSGLFDGHSAGLLLADHRGRLQFMAASDEHAQLVELLQVQADEGPCQDCYRQGIAVVNADLRTAEAKWPLFAPQAVAAGYRSVHAFPLRLRQEVIGALNLFGIDAGTLQDADARIIQALADIATIGLLQERAIRRNEVLTEQLQGALNSRIVIEQAKGALAQIHGRSPDEAFELLRQFSRHHNLSLSEVARVVVTDPTSIPKLTTPGKTSL